MGLGRLLPILILIGLGYFLYKRYLASNKKSSRPARKTVEKTVRCAHCQLHIPEHEAITSNGRYYCSREHMELDQNTPS